MKKLFTLIIATVCIMSMNINAQTTIELRKKSDNSLITNGSSDNITIEEGSSATDYKFYIKNTGATTISTRVKWEFLGADGLGGNVHTFCYPLTSLSEGSCTMPGGTETPDIILAAGEQPAEAAYGTIIKIGTATSVVVKYTVYEVGNETNAIEFTVTYSEESPNSINETSTKEFSVYPNPATDILNIHNEYGSNSHIEIYNVLGSLVERIESDFSNTISIDCNAWEKGYYFARLYSNNKIEKTVKLFITRHRILIKFIRIFL